MGQFLFSVTQSEPEVPEPPASGNWITRFDNTRWEGDTGFGTWVTDHWESTGGKTGDYLWLNEVGTWVEGFRPTKVRVSHGVGYGIMLQIRDTSLSAFYSNSNYESGQEVDIEMIGLDIGEFIVGQGVAAPYSVTNIEFFVPD